jgi:hypothetical protein
MLQEPCTGGKAIHNYKCCVVHRMANGVSYCCVGKHHMLKYARNQKQEGGPTIVWNILPSALLVVMEAAVEVMEAAVEVMEAAVVKNVPTEEVGEW